MYRIKQFSAMTGMPPSKVRFYEKHGLLSSNRMENGYRVFTPEDAFRSNAFRLLMQYGFSVEQAVEMLDAKQGTVEFTEALECQRDRLLREQDLLNYRLRKVNAALDSINTQVGSGFELLDIPDQLYVNASFGRDFSVSQTNAKAIALFYELLSITSCARVINKEDLFNESDKIDPNYVISMPEHEKHRLPEDVVPFCTRLNLGKCVRFRRRATREESVCKTSFAELIDYLECHGYSIRSDIFLVPSFLNLDGAGSDIETLYVPVR
jgi:DNA-binding transcriptional MerR regulator